MQLVLVSSSVFCQQLPYRKFLQFNGDIGAYLKYNFEERGNYLYAGRTFAQLMADLEINPILYTSTSWYFRGDIANQTGIILYFTINGEKLSIVKDQHISIYWETSVFHSNEKIRLKRLDKGNKDAKHYNSVMELNLAYPEDKWVKEHYDFYKNFRIKSISVNELP